MKHTITTAIIAGIIVAGITASAAPFERWKVKSIHTSKPFLNDTVDNKGKKFNTISLLGTSTPSRIQNASIVETDSATLILPDASDLTGNAAIIHLLETHLRADRFTKGKLKITSPVSFVAQLDGKEIISKESVEDSISTASEQSSSIRLEPERDYILSVRVLATPDDSIAPSLKAEFIPDAGFDSVIVWADPELKRRYNLDDTQFSERVTGVELSPDGRYLITRTYSVYDNDNTRYAARLIDLTTNRIINANLPWSASWMPVGNVIYYTRKTNDGYDLYNLDAVSGRESLVAQSIPVDRFTWSPDASYFIYSKTDDGIATGSPLRRYTSPDDRMPGNRKHSYLMMYSPADGIARQLTFGNHSTSLLDIAPDGKSILVYSSCENPTRRPFYDQTIYTLDLTSMLPDTIVVPSPQFVNSAEYSPDGRKILFTGSPNAFDGIGRNSGDHPVANDYDVQMFIMDLANHSIEPITRDFDPAVTSVIGWNKQDGNIYFLAEEGFTKPIYSYSPATAKFRKFPSAVTYIERADMPLHSSRRIAYTGQSYDKAGGAYLLDTKSGKTTVIDEPYAAHLNEIDFGKTEPWKFTAADGTVIDGYICLPPDFDAAKKYPLIVYYYGGTSPTVTTILQPYTPQLFASRDYVVYVINPSGTTGYGQEFSARHVNAWGKYTADDIIEGVQKFVQAHPFVDKDKIGCLGASYGGFMTQYLQTKTPIFAAAVSHAGISNVASYWGEGYWGYSYNSVAAADSYPWTNPQLYGQGSLFNADKINTPLLLLHGTADTNVPIGESIQLFNALRVLGKDVEFVSVDGENHFISDYPKRVLWHNTIIAFFDKYLKNDPAWWSDIYPD